MCKRCHMVSSSHAAQNSTVVGMIGPAYGLYGAAQLLESACRAASSCSVWDSKRNPSAPTQCRHESLHLRDGLQQVRAHLPTFGQGYGGYCQVPSRTQAPTCAPAQ